MARRYYEGDLYRSRESRNQTVRQNARSKQEGYASSGIISKQKKQKQDITDARQVLESAFKKKKR